MENKINFHIRDHKIGFITSLGFFFGLSVALVAYLGSSYYQQATGLHNVGIFYVVSFSCILFSLLNLHKAFLRFGRPRTLLILLAAQVIIVFILSIVPVGYFGAAMLMIYYILYGIIWVVWDAVLEAYSNDKETGRIRGMFLSVWGVGAIIGPLLSLTIFEKYGFALIFTIVLVLYILMLAIAMVALREIQGKIDTHVFSLKKMIRKITKKPALWQVYWVAISLSFAASTLVVFMPLKLREIGFEWSEMGIMFTIMLLPFVLLEYPAGLLADKKYGEKEMMFIGYIFLIVSIFFMVRVQANSFVLWTVILLFSRVGYALIEAMRDTYFYKQIDGKDVALINLFRTARPLAYVLSMILASILHILFGPAAVFYGLLAVLIISLYPVVIMQDTEPEE